MIRRLPTRYVDTLRLPRTRGDDPKENLYWGSTVQFAPHARG